MSLHSQTVRLATAKCVLSFRHVHETAKRNYTLASSRIYPSANLSTCSTLDGLPWNLIFQDFMKSVKKIQFWLKFDKNYGYFTWKPNKFVILPCWIFLTMRNVLYKTCRENQNTRFTYNNFFFSENHALYETMWRCMMQPGMPQMTIQFWAENTQFACLVTKARILTHIYNIWYFLLFHSNNSYMYVHQCYVLCILPLLLHYVYTPYYTNSDKNLIENAWG